MRGMDYGIGLLIADPAGHGLGSGGVTTIALPAGPGGVTRSCVQHGLYLVEDNGARLALLVHAREHGPFAELILDVAGPDADRLTSVLEEIRRLVSERSVFRGQVIAVGAWLEPKFGGQVPVTFLDRPAVGRVRCDLAGRRAGGHRTAGARRRPARRPGALAGGCSVARALQPSVVVLEDGT